MYCIAFFEDFFLEKCVQRNAKTNGISILKNAEENAKKNQLEFHSYSRVSNNRVFTIHDYVIPYTFIP